MKYFLLVGLLFAFTSSFAQYTEKEKLAQMEQQREFEKARQIRAQMDSGIYYMDNEKYAIADEKLKYALSNMKSIPSDLTFYFGKNSYFIGKYKQSIDWLTKYIQLKGTTGQHSAEASDWLKKSEAMLLQQQTAETQKALEVLSKDYTIDCGPTGKVTCPICNGSTVIIKKDYFGETYKACTHCHQKGYLTCEEYNLLLKGQLKPSK
ncbi:MAG: hypothetical protein HOP08_16560 [Cyclobacteriaceae bacterium]|nr:hypothetical protein [Cyclobacteriaceae bacterium]